MNRRSLLRYLATLAAPLAAIWPRRTKASDAATGIVLSDVDWNFASMNRSSEAGLPPIPHWWIHTGALFLIVRGFDGRGFGYGIYAQMSTESDVASITPRIEAGEWWWPGQLHASGDVYETAHAAQHACLMRARVILYDQLLLLNGGMPFKKLCGPDGTTRETG